MVEPKSVVGVRGRRLVREAGIVEGCKQPIARPISGKDSARAIAAVGRGRQPADQQTRAGIAEPGYGTAPILLQAEGGSLFAGHSFPPRDQSGATTALDNSAIDLADREVVD
jgi:hypothetical protein